MERFFFAIQGSFAHFSQVGKVRKVQLISSKYLFEINNRPRGICVGRFKECAYLESFVVEKQLI